MNRTLMVLIVIVAVVIVGMGFYRGWFSFTSDDANNKSNVTFSVDTDKLKADKKSAVESAENLGHQIKDKVSSPSEKSMDGKVVNVTDDKLTMSDKEGKEHTHAMAANVKVSCDGMECKPTDLKAGMRIRVTVNDATPQAATHVEALDKNPDFAKVG